MIFVEVLGLQRSGTCYLQWLIRNNFNADIACTTWKHNLPNESYGFRKKVPMGATAVQVLDTPAIKTVLIKKDLDHWLGSLERNPKDFYRHRGEVDAEDFYRRYHHAWTDDFDYPEDYDRFLERRRAAGL